MRTKWATCCAWRRRSPVGVGGPVGVRGRVDSPVADKTTAPLITPCCLPACLAGRLLPLLCAGSLELVEADLLTEGAFDAAFSGCSYIFHCASPFFIEAGDPQAELVDPAVRGTRNVMAAAAKNRATVRRVVLTSSCAAVKGMGSPAAPVQGSTYSEADWNETSSLPGEAYWVSKVQAERAAWEAAKEAGLDLITILPGALRWASCGGLCCAVLCCGLDVEVCVGAGLRELLREHVQGVPAVPARPCRVHRGPCCACCAC